MKYIASVVYAPPRIPDRDKAIIAIAAQFGGTLHSVDEPPDCHNIELWFEFPSADAVREGGRALHDANFFVEEWGTWDD